MSRRIVVTGAVAGLLSVSWAQPRGQADGGVRLHYLGHAAFVLQLDEGVVAVTDLGESRSYGLDSPIYGLAGLVPSVATFSHRHHVDHDGKRLPEGVAHVLTGNEGLRHGGVRITPILTYEASLDEPDNSSYVFEARGRKILHLGDVQALILASDQPRIAQRIREMYPGPYDAVMLPIGFTRDIVQGATRFADLFDTGAVIPMHYWNPADRDAFCARLAGRQRADGRRYVRLAPGGPAWNVSPPREGEVLIVTLDPAPWAR